MVVSGANMRNRTLLSAIKHSGREGPRYEQQTN
jgi:hypothetical protein